MTNHAPRVIFVDGPNGVGKDYAVEQLTKALQLKSYDVTVFSAKKYLPPFIKDKRFFTFNFFDADKLSQILDAHIATINDIEEHVLTTPDNHVVIVNRSFLSALIYNYGIGADKNTPHTEAWRQMVSSDALASYKQYYRHVLSVKSALLLLHKFHDFDYPVYGDRYETFKEEEFAHFKKKVIERGQEAPDVQFDHQYLDYLLTSYRTPPITFVNLFENCVFTDSSNLSGITDLY